MKVLDPIRERYTELAGSRKGEVEDRLEANAAKCRAVAAETMLEVKGKDGVEKGMENPELKIEDLKVDSLGEAEDPSPSELSTDERRRDGQLRAGHAVRALQHRPG